MGKRVWICLMLIALLAFPVGAKELGSVCLVMRYHGEIVTGGSVKLYNVTGFPADAEPENLVKFLDVMGADGNVRPVGKDGTVCFDGLEPGYYLLAQEQQPSGYRPMKPFLVSVPITVNGRVQYEIVARPKLEEIPHGKLPQTGQLNLLVWVMMGGGIFMTGIGILIWRRK